MQTSRSALSTAETERRHGRAMVARKLVHATLSLVAAAVVWSLPHPMGAVGLAAASTVALSVELARRVHLRFARRFLATLGSMLRDRETTRLTGATTLVLGYTAAATLVGGRPAVAGILVTGLADPVAALVGTHLGRRRYRGGKSLEGSVAFLAAAVAVLLIASGLGLVGAVAVGLALTIAEAPRLPLDDNLYLPLLGALAVAIAGGSLMLGGFS